MIDVFWGTPSRRRATMVATALLLTLILIYIIYLVFFADDFHGPSGAGRAIGHLIGQIFYLIVQIIGGLR